MINRRDFIKLMGGALGGVALASCGSRSSDEAQIAPIPNGYAFYKVVSSGISLPGGHTLGAIPGTVMLNDRNEIYFYGMDETETNGYYELTIDYGGSRPKVETMRKVVREGDALNNSKTVSQITVGDTNSRGSFAAVLHTDDNLPGLYLEREKSGFEPVVSFRTPLPGGGGTFGGSFGDVDLHHNDDILLVSHFAPSDSAQGHQGVIHLPGGEVNQSGAIVASTRDFIPDSEGLITGVGLVDMHDNGNYVVQAYGSVPGQTQKSAQKLGGTMDAVAASLLISGNVKKSSSKVLKTYSPTLKILQKSSSLAGASVGEIMYGPRIGASNNAAYVSHVNETHQVLNYSGKQVVAVGSVTPLGATIGSLSAPVVGGDGLLYYQAATNQGFELMVYNGPEIRTILSNDDVVDGSVLKSFFSGFMPDQVDSSGRIVLTGDFADGSTSIIIGIPI